MEEVDYKPRNVVASRNWKQFSAGSQQKTGPQSYNTKELDSVNPLNEQGADSRTSMKATCPYLYVSAVRLVLNCKIHLCCCKPLTVWLFVTATIEN